MVTFESPFISGYPKLKLKLWAWCHCAWLKMSGMGSSSGGPQRTANFPYCPEIGKYEKMAKVGQGTFG